MLNIAVRAARRAGSIINRAALDGSALAIRVKNVNDFVTQIDRAAEEAIIETVRRAYPDHAILAEESGSTAGARAEYCWVIDPLDGTTNFIHAFPQYCVSVAVQHRGATAHGVVYDPVRNELFTASKGRGAFVNDRRMRVSKCEKLKQALVGTGRSQRSGARRREQRETRRGAASGGSTEGALCVRGRLLRWRPGGGCAWGNVGYDRQRRARWKGIRLRPVLSVG